MHPFINKAVSCIRQNSTFLVRSFKDIEASGSNNSPALIKSVNKAIDHIKERMSGELKEAYPSHTVITDLNASEKRTTEYTWYIGMPDGLSNFLNGYFQYSISAMVIHKNKCHQMIVYDPNLNNLVTSSIGDGAYFNNQRMRVSRQPELNNTPIAVYMHSKNVKNIVDRLLAHNSNIRISGCHSLDAVNVAIGSLGASISTNLHEPMKLLETLLIQESGGISSDLGTGDDIFLSSHPDIHQKIKNIILNNEQ